jgi:hypothetical protein
MVAKMGGTILPKGAWLSWRREDGNAIPEINSLFSGKTSYLFSTGGSMVTKIAYSKCVDGYMLSIYARHLSERIIESYEVVLRRFGEFLANDPPFSEISPDQVRQFLSSFEKVTNKTLLNYHIVLSSMWHWPLANSWWRKISSAALRHPSRRNGKSSLMPKRMSRR